MTKREAIAMIVFVLAFISLIASPVFAQNTQPNFDTLISEYSTSYAVWGEEKGRAKNIELASRAFSDLIVQPGEIVSYNKLVGARTEDKGFYLAHVILKGRLVDDFGGGACQVSGTLHAALLYAGGFGFVERTHHTRKSTYLNIGLDATVVWLHRDFQFENQFPFPVKIVREITQDPNRKGKRVLTFKIFGLKKLYQVTTQYETLDYEKMKIIKWRSQDPTFTKAKILDAGSNGYKVVFYVHAKNLATGETIISEERINYKMAEKLVVLPYKSDIAGQR